MDHLFIASILLGSFVCTSLGVQLKFELPDDKKMCFFENIKGEEETTFQYHVLSGGNYDVDVEVSGPNKQFVYREMKKQYDIFTWKVFYGGIHKFCFSNEFSTFTHKIVFFRLQVGKELPVGEQQGGEHYAALTMMETSLLNIFVNLNNIIQAQTLYRLDEVYGRSFAENLHAQVSYWSLGESLVVIFIGISQVMVLRNFFKNTFKTSVPTIH